MTRLTSTLVIIIPLLAAACVNAITCGSATCSDTQECCNDFRNGFVCYDKTTYSCPATTTSTGAAGNLLCPSNKVACGEACYSESEYSCCNRQLAPKGTCASPTNSPTSAPTSSPTTPVTSAPVVLNCPGANNFGGVNCSDASLCCGYGTITPSCLPADGSKKCCVHYKASTQCNPDETCGGSGGPGASSYASCGKPGTTFCDKGTGQGTFCTAELPTCCGYYSGFGFCCAAGCACNNSYYTCSCPSTSTSAPSTVAPTTVAPTTRVTSAPVTSAPVVNNCPGANNFGGVNCSDASLCCGYGTITPSCLPADGSKKCCTHYKASTQCNLDETCGGSGGPGASSYASCGKPGTTFCDKGTGQGAFCTADAPTCCGYTSGFGFCCAAGCACNNSYYTCSCPSTATTAPSTAAPVTSAPTTYAIPTTVRPTCASGQSLCGDTCFDVSKEFCCGNRVVCGSGQSCNIGQAYSTCCNRTLSYCGKPEFGVKCYDPSTQVCCGAEVYMPTVCGTDETCRLFPSAGCDKKSS